MGGFLEGEGGHGAPAETMAKKRRLRDRRRAAEEEDNTASEAILSKRGWWIWEIESENDA